MEQLYDNNIYAVGTVRSTRKGMPTMMPAKSMKRGDMEMHCCKRYDNKNVLLLATNVEGMDSSSQVLR